MAERVPFFTLFESFQAPRQLRLLLHDACAVSGVLDREARTLEVQIECGETLKNAVDEAKEDILRATLGVDIADIAAEGVEWKDWNINGEDAKIAVWRA